MTIYVSSFSDYSFSFNKKNKTFVFDFVLDEFLSDLQNLNRNLANVNVEGIAAKQCTDYALPLIATFI